MIAAKELTGDRFGRLVAIRRDGKTQSGQAIWLWKCDCGKEKQISATNVTSGKVRSCGCLQAESRTKHGRWDTKTYRAWQNMKARVNGNTSRGSYKDRGIGICARWKENFTAFLEDMGECPEGLTLERIKNDEDYRPDNCRWAPQSDQLRNTRRTHRVELDGEMMCLLDACRLLGFSYRRAMRLLATGSTAQLVVSRAAAARSG